MANTVPTFTPEWLEQYNRRLADFREKDARTQAEARANAAKRRSPEKPRAEGEGRADPLGTRTRTPVRTRELVPTELGEQRPVPIRGWTGKQTATERRYNAQCLFGHGRFEAVCLYLPSGGRYTPDFMTMENGGVTFHEVKGSYRLNSQGRAYTAFHEAAAAFPCFRFVWAVERKGGGFDVKTVDRATEIER